jgi:hypothetical protein
MKLAPTWHWRAQYSLGFSDSVRMTSAPKIASCEPSACDMRTA